MVNCCVGEHTVGASHGVFDRTNMAFDVGDVFVCGAGIQVGKPGLDWFKLIVSQCTGDVESPVVVNVQHGS